MLRIMSWAWFSLPPGQQVPWGAKPSLPQCLPHRNTCWINESVGDLISCLQVKRKTTSAEQLPRIRQCTCSTESPLTTQPPHRLPTISQMTKSTLTEARDSVLPAPSIQNALMTHHSLARSFLYFSLHTKAAFSEKPVLTTSLKHALVPIPSP